jgi:hypothetical protein
MGLGPAVSEAHLGMGKQERVSRSSVGVSTYTTGGSPEGQEEGELEQGVGQGLGCTWLFPPTGRLHPCPILSSTPTLPESPR